MEKSVPLSFRYKGARNYVHGTDLYDSLRAAFGVEPPLRFLLRHNLTSNAVAVACDPKSTEVLSAAASIYSRLGCEDEVHIAVFADPSRPVDGRYEYDEDAIADSIVFGSESLELARNDAFTPIERVVAANKLLLQRSPRSLASQWWFARIDLDAHLTREDSYRLVFNGIRGQQFAATSIEREASRIGRIYFFARGQETRQGGSTS